jgi:hypothetical protein
VLLPTLSRPEILAASPDSEGSARALFLAIAATTAALTVAVPANAAASTTAVINEVYGGGGNSGATYTNDFIELTNLGSTPIAVDGWSVQYHSASATGSWQVTPLSGTLAPGEFCLIAEAQGAGGTTPLPPPQASGTIAMSATAGTVAARRAGAGRARLRAADPGRGREGGRRGAR